MMDLGDYPGIEYWSLTLTLTYADSSIAGPPSVTVAHASLYRVDTNLCWNISDLDYLSDDLGVIAGAIVTSSKRLEEWFLSTILIADIVVVDKFWRGKRLGPALVLFAADLLRADASFLIPVALRTPRDASGEYGAVYDLPRPGPEAQAKVRAAWRRAGFQKLANGVVWAPTTPDKGAAARARLIRLERKDAEEDAAKRWWRRRARRQVAAIALGEGVSPRMGGATDE